MHADDLRELNPGETFQTLDLRLLDAALTIGFDIPALGWPDGWQLDLDRLLGHGGVEE